jgi:type III restriction enzyme
MTLQNCKDIGHAEEVGALLESDQFMDGAFIGRVIVVHSNQTDEALAKLDEVEAPGNTTRIIVQVGMLKEGWDVKSVYVIASLRASLSEVLTEQTMGRGLRLPFGAYTGWQMLDTLDILAHDQYEKVLKRAQALQEDFIDYRTVITTTITATGDTVLTVAQRPVAMDVTTDEWAATATGGEVAEAGMAGAGVIRVVDLETREQEAAVEAKPLKLRRGVPTIAIPKTEATVIPVAFSLSKITDLTPYRELGRRLAAAGSDVLQRRMLDATIVTTSDGGRRTQLATPSAVDSVSSQVDLLPVDEARQRVVQEVRQHRVIPGRAGEGEHVSRLIDAVIEGASAKAVELLSRFPSRVASEVVFLIGQAAAVAPKSQITTTVAVEPFAPKPQNERPDPSTDLISKFKARAPYTGWKRCMYKQAWFDSEPERHLAVIVDAEDAVESWTRLYRGDLPILWNGAENEYNPDFLVTTTDGDAWIIEVKSDKDAKTVAVEAKRQAALEWVNTVNANKTTDRRWHYLLATETDLKTASGSWATLVSTCDA